MVQSLTPFRHPTRESASPLAGISTLDALLPSATAAGIAPEIARRLMDLTDRLFSGRFWAYHPIDLHYHDLAHTAQASHTYLALVTGHIRDQATSPDAREYTLGLAAILLHDTGFLRAIGDDQGSGAKYTHTHVLRSCALAASVLPGLGFNRNEVDDVVGMIRCTGLTGKPDNGTFTTELARTVARMVATADYIGQMAAPDYPEKLRHLFAEFEEADDYSHVPRERRLFRSTEHLLGATRGFWQGFVLPKLERDFAGVFRHLAVRPPSASNPHLEAIELNLTRIEASLAPNR